jgi:asparagine synthase (glutamine-hydrolysing)
LQLQQLVYCLRFFGPSRRARAAELIHPLLSQPVVELCLSIPADMLAEGGRDRGLARRAFTERLPPAVIERRSKGDLTGFYGAAIAHGLPELRETLLEGRLVARGVLDARVLSNTLDLDRLAVQGRHGEIMALAALELWARCWQTRLDRAGLARHR